MKGLEFSRYAFGFCAALTMLAGCGGSQPTIGVPNVMQQTSAIVPTSSIVPRTLPGSSYRVLHRFGPSRADGAYSHAGFINVNGTLYSTTWAGGSFGAGTVYRISTTGEKSLLHSFGGGSDGKNPFAGLIDVNDTLYGTTDGGGSSGKGSIYRISTTGKETVLHSFKGGSDGASPGTGLINVNGTLYGTTDEGGSGCSGTYGCGIVYSVSTTGLEKVLYRFTGGSDGANPDSSLIAVNGALYGTTYLGGGSGCYGGNGCGTVYSISTTGREKVLYRFAGAPDGAQPLAALLNINGRLYGTTQQGGSGCGTVYRISTVGVENILHSFGHHSDGCGPSVQLIDVKGTLYGTTDIGGLSGNGTVYSISTAGVEKVLYGFAGGSDGVYPQAPLLNVKRTLYGTTFYGGGGRGCHNGCGIVFALIP